MMFMDVPTYRAEFSYRLSKADILKVQLRSGMSSRLVWIMSLGFSVHRTLDAVDEKGEFSWFVFVVVCAMFFIAFYMVLNSIAFIIGAIRVMSYKSDNVFLEPKQVVITEDGITCKGSSTESTLKWESMEPSWKWMGVLILPLKGVRTHTVIMPLRDMSDEHVQFIEKHTHAR